MSIYKHDFFRKNPAMAALATTQNPGGEHIRACLMELVRYVLKEKAESKQEQKVVHVIRKIKDGEALIAISDASNDLDGRGCDLMISAVLRNTNRNPEDFKDYIIETIPVESWTGPIGDVFT